MDQHLQGCVRLCDHCIGADKIGHMFAQGWEYYRISVLDKKGDAIAERYGMFLEGKGKPEDYTEDEAKYFGGISEGFAGGPVGYGGFGRNASFVISNADLSANAAGLRFYKDVAAGRFKTICDYVDKNWDEEQNFNEYADELAKIVAANGRR